MSVCVCGVHTGVYEDQERPGAESHIEPHRVLAVHLGQVA